MPCDSGDILGLAEANVNSRRTLDGAANKGREKDALVDSKPRVRDGVFGGLDVELLSETQLSRVLELDSKRIDLKEITRLLRANGTPAVSKTGVIPKMVSEACKIFIFEVVRLSREENIDLLSASALISRRYRL